MGEKEKREKKRKEIKKDHKNIVMLNAIQICSNLTKKKSIRVKLEKYLLVSIRYMLYGHEKSFLGKNLRQYLLMGM